MLKLQGNDVYLAALEREDCQKVWDDFEYDEQHACEPFQIGYSKEKALEWFQEIQRNQLGKSLRLGIFLNSGEVVGDVALQEIDYYHRCCGLGCGIAKVKNRGNGYGTQAMRLLIEHAFWYTGMERITATTLEHNMNARKALEKCGFTLEGRERRAVYMNGRRYDRMDYGILKSEVVKEE